MLFVTFAPLFARPVMFAEPQGKAATADKQKDDADFYQNIKMLLIDLSSDSEEDRRNATEKWNNTWIKILKSPQNSGMRFRVVNILLQQEGKRVALLLPSLFEAYEGEEKLSIRQRYLVLFGETSPFASNELGERIRETLIGVMNDPKPKVLLPKLAISALVRSCRLVPVEMGGFLVTVQVDFSENDQQKAIVGKALLAKLREMINEEKGDEDSMVSLVEAMGKLKAVESIGDLAGLVDEGAAWSHKVQSTALNAIGAIGTPGAADALIEKYDDPRLEILEEIARIFGFFQPRIYLQKKLVSILRNEDGAQTPRRRLGAAVSLGKMGDPSTRIVLENVRRLLLRNRSEGNVKEDPDGAIAGAIEEALKEIKREPEIKLGIF